MAEVTNAKAAVFNLFNIGSAFQKDFLFYQQVLAQQPKDKNKIYSLHEPDAFISLITIVPLKGFLR
jgi:hypothetical protein